jgi:hypothetical protein
VKKRLDVYPKGKWTNQQLEKAMDVMEGRLTSLRKANKH